MGTSWRLILAMGFWMILTCASFAQSFQFRHLTIEDGLSQSSVNCIMQDSYGFLWFGTQDGLNRYDGYGFKVFRTDPADSNSISHNWIWDIFEDRSGKIWIATWKGLTKYDPVTGRFKRYLPDPDRPGSIPGERPASVCQDRDGNVWIGIWGGGVARYDPATDGFVGFLSDPGDEHSLPGNFVRCLFFDRQDRLWVGTWTGLALGKVEEDGSLSFVRFLHDENNPASLGSNHVMTVLEDHEGRIWIGTRGGGLNLFSEKDSSFVRFTYHRNDRSSISSDDVCFLYEDSRNRFWAGTFTEGLNLFDRARGTFTRIYEAPDDPGGLLSNNVFSMLEDKSGLLWIGAGGLNILDQRMVGFRHYHYSKKKKYSLNNNNISAFYEDKNGIIWIGTRGGGLNRFDRRSDRFRAYKHKPEDSSSISSNQVSAIAGNGSGILWVATLDNGLNRFDPASGKFDHILEIPSSAGDEVIQMKYINDLTFTSSDTLWIATDNVGLVCYSPKHHKGKAYKKITWQDREFSMSSLLSLCPGKEGELWIGTWGVGLFSLHIREEKFAVFPVNEKDTTSIAGNMVHVICETEDSLGRILWVGTNRGLSRMRPDGPDRGRFRHITMKNGLASNIIYGILQDGAGNMWFSTNKGLSRFNPMTQKIRNFDVRDGLQSNEFNARSCLKLRDGTLLFGGMKGFNMFRPDTIKDSDYRPPVVLTSFRVFNREMDFGKDLREIRRIALTWKQNFFSFEFAALDFAQPAKIQYAYRMTGVDKEWVYSGNRRYASYTRIDPGEYLFQVKATNRDGIWSDRMLTLNIVVKPPFWRTWWFKTLGVILFVLLLYGLHRMQLQKLLAVERLRVRIASDLHDDVGSALTRISIASEQMQVTKDRNRLFNLSKTVGTISREIISTMGDIIWSIDARNDTLLQLTDRMQDHAFSAFEMRNIRVDFHQHGMRKKKKIPVDYRQNIFYIFKEAINNIVKHAEATQVTIKLDNSEKGFVMEIEDNGKGFDTDMLSKGNGLKNMKMRAGRLKANLEVKADHGVKIILKMRKL